MVIPIALPALAFDFDREATEAAVGEACAGEATDCSLDALCAECNALKVGLVARLTRAFLAGQASMVSRGDLL